MNRQQRVQYFQPNYQPAGGVAQNSQNYTSARLNDLTNILQDTNQNLKDIDDEINYKHSREYRRNDRSRSRNNRECDYNSDSSSMKYYSKSSMSETEDDYSSHGPDRFARRTYGNKGRKHRANVLFADDMNESLHNNQHHRMRDASFHECDREARLLNAQRNGEIRMGANPYLKHNQNINVGLEQQMENRLKNVYQKMRQHRECAQTKTNMDSIINEMSRNRQTDQLNQANTLQQIIAEAEKNKAQNEMLQTKKRLQELEESKHGLAAEVQHLKDQLHRFDSPSSQFSASAGCTGTNKNANEPLRQEIEMLKSELARQRTAESHVPIHHHHVPRPPCVPDQSLEVIKTIEKYEKQKDFFQDHNQALKVLLKEKEKAEHQQAQELQILKEKNSVLELNNCKLQSEMDNLFNKYNEMNAEAEKYANYLRSTEDQLSLSEKKRDELKVDAQETIKLWKNKVKKLEKNLERHKSDAKSLGEQNQGLIGNFNNLTSQIEARNQEASVLREINGNLENKVKAQEIEINHLKMGAEDLKSQSVGYKEELLEVKNLNKSLELKLNDLLNDKMNLERQKATEENKNYDLGQKVREMQTELETMRLERKDLDNYVGKLEAEVQKLRGMVDNMTQSECDAKDELNTFSKQAMMQKENYEDTISKYSSQLQQHQYQIQKMRLEYEDNIRQLSSQLVENKSNLDYYKSAEAENLNEIDTLKCSKRRLEDDYFDLNDKLDKYLQSDAYKSRVIKELDDKKQKLTNELNSQRNEFFAKETEYLKMLNLIDVEADVIVGMISSNMCETYKPLLNVDESNKSSSLYLLIKHKLNWFGKSVEEQFQKQAKLQQSLKFLELEIQTQKKTNDSNMKTQNYFLKNLESQNSELISERAVALKNMELLQTYLQDLNESVKTQTMREIEKSHHMHVVDHVNHACKSSYLSDAEKEEINKRFKQYKKTICDIKSQLDNSDKGYMRQHQCQKEHPKFVSSSVSSFGGQNEYRKFEKKKKSGRPAFKC